MYAELQCVYSKVKPFTSGIPTGIIALHLLGIVCCATDIPLMQVGRMVNKRQYLIHAITAVAVCIYDTGGVAETLQKCEFFQLGRRRNGTTRIVET